MLSGNTVWQRNSPGFRTVAADGSWRVSGQSDIPARQPTQITAYLKSPARRGSLFVVQTTSGIYIKPDTGKIIESLISFDPFIDRGSLGHRQTSRNIFPRFEGRHRRFHAAGATIITRLNHRKSAIVRPVIMFIGPHYSPVQKTRSA